MATRSGWQNPEDVAHVYILRGAILTAISHIELCIAELSLRASYMPEYDVVSSRWRSLPPSTSQRVEFLTEVIKAEGPLQFYARSLERALRRWSDFREVRNRMAHGHMTVFRGGPIRFREIVAKRSEITQATINYYGSELEACALRIARFSRVYQRLWYRARGSDFMPTINDAVVFHEGELGPAGDAS